MCGRYALGIRAAFVRHQFQQQGLPVDDAPEDDAVRETYNFPPGSYGLVYRADVPDHGVQNGEQTHASDQQEGADDEPQLVSENASAEEESTQGSPHKSPHKGDISYRYQLQAMKWGLIPFWTKRSPDYGSMLRTINARDDSLMENRGMWTTMKQRKRCIVICQGFYEWLKKGPGGKEKVPHFVKRKDGLLMCFAGLWDCVKYEDSEEKLYTYTIITTDSNKQLSFLHDRMPVILDAGSEAMRVWLEPGRSKWSKELQSLLKPYEGELECYPVSQEVGKVGNNSPNFIVPVDSKENKKNIANFFGNMAKTKKTKESSTTAQSRVLQQKPGKEVEVEREEGEDRVTKDHNGSSEDNAPLPIPPATNSEQEKTGDKRKHRPAIPDQSSSPPPPPSKATKFNISPEKPLKSSAATMAKSPRIAKSKRSATHNEPLPIKKGSNNSPPKQRPAQDGSQRITNFFGK